MVGEVISFFSFFFHDDETSSRFKRDQANNSISIAISRIVLFASILFLLYLCRNFEK